MIYLMSEPELDPSPPTTTLALPSPSPHWEPIIHQAQWDKGGHNRALVSRELVSNGQTHTGSKDMSSGLEALG